MKNSLIFLGIILLINTEIFPQCNPAPAERCEDAIVQCGFNVFYGMSCTSFDYANPTGCSPLCPNLGGVANNTSWWAFVTNGGNICITMSYNNCTFNGKGLEFGIIGNCNCESQILCDPTCTGPGTKTACATVDPCKTYYLFVDGCTYDVCDFTILTSGGTSIPQLPPLNSISGINVVCQGSCDVKFKTSLTGNTLCTPNYAWTLDNVSIPGDQEEVLVDFPNAGTFNICVTAILGNNCDTEGPVCKTVTVNRLPERIDGPRYICSEDVPITWENHSITKSGLYKTTYSNQQNCCVFDSAVSFIVLEKSPVPNIYLIMLAGETYRDQISGNSFNLCQEGTNIQLGRNSKPYKCDSSYNLYLNFVDIIPSISQNCDAGQYSYSAEIKDKTCNLGGFVIDKPEYAWYRYCDPNKKILGTTKDLNVNTRDEYCVDISVLAHFEKIMRKVTVTICEKEEEDLPEYVHQCTDYPTLQGKVYIDNDGNGHYDVGEVIIEDAIIQSDISGTSTISNKQGYFLRLANDTSCDVSISFKNSKYYDISPLNYVVNTKTLVGLLPVPHSFELKEKFKNDLEVKIAGTQAIADKTVRFYIALSNLANLNIPDANLKVEVPPGWNVLQSTVPYTLIDRNIISWEILPQIDELSKLDIVLDLKVPSGVLPNEFFQVKAFVKTNQDANSSNNEFVWNDNVLIEPKTIQKIVSDSSIGKVGKDFNELIYTLRFQNSFLTPANSVRLKDIFSNDLDPSSIRIIQASHPIQWDMNTPGFTRITFEGINLTASSNFIGSQGLVQIGIKPRTNIADRTIIKNVADVQFNCNPYIKSNEVTTIYVITSNKTNNLQSDIRINPNPFNGYLDISSPKIYTNAKIKVFDISGKLIHEFKFNHQNKLRIQSTDWSSGVYQIALYNDNKLKSMQKLVKN